MVTPRVSLLVAALLVLAMPLMALYDAWIYSSIWGLLVRPQYGNGPSYESWYGISMLIWLLITMSVKQSLSRSASDEDESALRGITKIFGRMIVMLFTLGLAYGIRAVLGWS